MTVVIQTEKLTKAYGPHRGIVDLDLEVADGEAGLRQTGAIAGRQD